MLLIISSSDSVSSAQYSKRIKLFSFPEILDNCTTCANADVNEGEIKVSTYTLDLFLLSKMFWIFLDSWNELLLKYPWM